MTSISGIRSAHWQPWREEPSPHRPLNSRVDIFLTPAVPPDHLLPALTNLITADELQGAIGKQGNALQARTICSHATLRLLLSLYLDLPPRDVRLETGVGGKPILGQAHKKMPELHFNLSHSRAFNLFGFAAEPLGIDIEELSPIALGNGMEELVLSPAERARFQSIDASNRLDFFLRAWVCKEAIAKRTGEGLGLDFCTLDALQDDGTAMPNGKAGQVHVKLFEPFKSHRAALATSAPLAPSYVRIHAIEDLLTRTLEGRDGYAI